MFFIYYNLVINKNFKPFTGFYYKFIIKKLFFKDIKQVNNVINSVIIIKKVIFMFFKSKGSVGNAYGRIKGIFMFYKHYNKRYLI